MTSRHGRLLYAPFTLVSETHKREKTPTRLRHFGCSPKSVTRIEAKFSMRVVRTRMYILGSVFGEISTGILESRMVGN